MKNDLQKEKKRQDTIGLLVKRMKILPESHNIFHGRLKRFLPSCSPTITWQSQNISIKNRISHSEFVDLRDILQEKVNFVIKLLSESRHTTIYTGAGVSTSAGVRQAARGSRRTVRKSHTTNAKEVSKINNLNEMLFIVHYDCSPIIVMWQSLNC